MFNFSYDTYFDFMDKVTIGEYYNEANNSEIQLMWNKHILEPLQVRTWHHNLFMTLLYISGITHIWTSSMTYIMGKPRKTISHLCGINRFFSQFRLGQVLLRIPDSYGAKIAQICNLWTFWPAIQFSAELQARMSRDSRILLFSHHNYQVSLTKDQIIFSLSDRDFGSQYQDPGSLPGLCLAVAYSYILSYPSQDIWIITWINQCITVEALIDQMGTCFEMLMAEINYFFGISIYEGNLILWT